jgi:hypothetical protein
MTIPSFVATMDTVPPVADQFVVCLGRPASLPALAKDKSLVVDAVTEEVASLLGRIDPTLMRGGLVIVTTRAAYADQPRAVVRAQKVLVYLFAKYVQLPLGSTRVPDHLALRPADTPPEYLHQLNVYRNTPFHLRHCLIDKVRDAQVGLPCLLLLPGPSLASLGPWLPELSRRFLIVTISRVLPLLRAHGLAPDVLLQLDTVPLQEHFHHPDDRFPRSILLALSMAPIANYAPKFRQLFFIDSFDLAALPSTVRLRESWLSSLLACLGCVEILKAPKVLLAGADLRYVGQAVYHGDLTPDKTAEFPAYDAPATCQDNRVTLADARGRRAETSVQYFAAAAEAELFAREIRAAVGTAFYNLSSVSLLDPEVYAPISLEAARQEPEIDKQPFLDKMDAAARHAERLNLLSLRARYSRGIDEARHTLQVLDCLLATAPASLPQHPYYRYIAANLPWFRPASEDGLARLAGNLATEMLDAARFARNSVSLRLQAAKGRPVPVLCTTEEETAVRQQLSGPYPDCVWRCHGLAMPGTGRPAPSDGSLELATLHDWLQVQDVVLVAPGFAKEYHYVLSLVAGDNVIAMAAPVRNVAQEGEGEAE